MPLEIFKAPSSTTWQWAPSSGYQVLWLQEVWHWSPLHFAVGWTPFVILDPGDRNSDDLDFKWPDGDRATAAIILGADLSVRGALFLLSRLCVNRGPDHCHPGLGFASTIEVQIARRLDSRIMGIGSRCMYFGVAISAVALILDVCFVRLVKDEREGWEERT
ncbi:hypothetical protein BDV28DRAFT_150840 [Aspergillus coremiiformis]|uniref:Uncharacterized protein n=1 Tax=Aspergillus coremiiformis TaxID=138285 RepID=A0A5N6YYN7_9EURO|nr:hypothetical protein BDV28DRAFT_150840 [Aspergillus coremiiformis]